MRVNVRNFSRSIPLNYISFSILYCLGIMFAVFLGATGRLVSDNSLWFRTTDFIIIMDLTVRLSIVLLPISVLMILNTVRFEELLQDRTFSHRDVIENIVSGVFAFLPLLFITIYFYIQMSFFISWPFVVVAQTFIASSFLLVCALTISAIISSNTFQSLICFLKNPYTWSAAIVLGAILMFPTVALINPLTKGYFHYFPSVDQILFGLPDLILRGLMLGLVLPALSFVLVRLNCV